MNATTLLTNIDSGRTGRVGIALATYNGSRYLAEFLASLQGQTFQDWTAYIRDDNSSDSTPLIQQHYASLDKRFHLIGDDKENLGAKKNFERILDWCLNDGCSYVFLADQDDVWDSEKLDLMLRRMAEIEENEGSHEAILLHTDLEVVDENMLTINRSFMVYQKLLGRNIDSVGKLLMHNTCTGCAMLLNRALAERCLPFGSANLQHDWWVSLIASVTGQIHYLDLPLVRYRQHTGNRVGAKGYWNTYSVFNRSLGHRIFALRSKMVETVRQADECFQAVSRHSGVKTSDLQCIDLYRKILLCSRGKRLFKLVRADLFPDGFWRGLLLYTALISLARRDLDEQV